jgi:hypothetical protein
LQIPRHMVRIACGLSAKNCALSCTDCRHFRDQMHKGRIVWKEQLFVVLTLRERRGLPLYILNFISSLHFWIWFQFCGWYSACLRTFVNFSRGKDLATDFRDGWIGIPHRSSRLWEGQGLLQCTPS